MTQKPGQKETDVICSSHQYNLYGLSLIWIVPS